MQCCIVQCWAILGHRESPPAVHWPVCAQAGIVTQVTLDCLISALTVMYCHMSCIVTCIVTQVTLDWHILAHAGPDCHVLAHTGIYWHILSHSFTYCLMIALTVIPHCHMLSHTGTYCPTLAYTGTKCHILAHTVKHCKTLAYNLSHWTATHWHTK